MCSLSLVPDAELLTVGYFLGDRGGAPCSNEATLGALLAASGRGQADKPGSAAWNVQPHLLSSERGERLGMALMVDHAYMTTLLKTPKLRRLKSFWVGEHIRVLEGGPHTQCHEDRGSCAWEASGLTLRPSPSGCPSVSFVIDQ